MPQFTPFWGSNTAARSAGVAILIRTSLIDNQSIKIHSPHADIDGRLMHLKNEWGGHSIRLINSYLPVLQPDPHSHMEWVTAWAALNPSECIGGSRVIPLVTILVKRILI